MKFKLRTITIEKNSKKLPKSNKHEVGIMGMKKKTSIKITKRNKLKNEIQRTRVKRKEIT